MGLGEFGLPAIPLGFGGLLDLSANIGFYSESHCRLAFEVMGSSHANPS